MGQAGLRRYVKVRTRVSEREIIFFAIREGKRSSCGAQGRRGMGAGASEWILHWEGYKREVGEVAILQGWAGWKADHAHGLCGSVPLICLSCPQQVINRNCERGP